MDVGEFLLLLWSDAQQLLLGRRGQDHRAKHLSLNLAQALLLDGAQDVDRTAVVACTERLEVCSSLGGGFLVCQTDRGHDTHLRLVFRAQGVKKGTLERGELQILPHGLKAEQDGNRSRAVRRGRGRGQGSREEQGCKQD